MEESGSVQIKNSVFCSLFSCLCSRFSLSFLWPWSLFCDLHFLSLVSFSLSILCTLFSFPLYTLYSVLFLSLYFVLVLGSLSLSLYFVLWSLSLSAYFVLVRTMFSFSLYTLYYVLLLCSLFSVHVHLTLFLVLSFLLSSVFFSLSCLGNAVTVLGSIPASRYW